MMGDLTNDDHAADESSEEEIVTIQSDSDVYIPNDSSGSEVRISDESESESVTDYVPPSDYNHILDQCSDDDQASPECREAVYEMLDRDNA